MAEIFSRLIITSSPSSLNTIISYMSQQDILNVASTSRFFLLNIRPLLRHAAMHGRRRFLEFLELVQQGTFPHLSSLSYSDSGGPIAAGAGGGGGQQVYQHVFASDIQRLIDLLVIHQQYHQHHHHQAIITPPPAAAAIVAARPCVPPPPGGPCFSSPFFIHHRPTGKSRWR